jgi:hypothetical protein
MFSGSWRPPEPEGIRHRCPCADGSAGSCEHQQHSEAQLINGSRQVRDGRPPLGQALQKRRATDKSLLPRTRTSCGWPHPRRWRLPRTKRQWPAFPSIRGRPFADPTPGILPVRKRQSAPLEKRRVRLAGPRKILARPAIRTRYCLKAAKWPAPALTCCREGSARRRGLVWTPRAGSSSAPCATAWFT